MGFRTLVDVIDERLLNPKRDGVRGLRFPGRREPRWLCAVAPKRTGSRSHGSRRATRALGPLNVHHPPDGRWEDMPAITGWSHVALTITDLKTSVPWYEAVLQVRELFRFSTDDFDRVLLGHESGVVLALTQHAATVDGPFEPRRIGLDHLSWRVEREQDLDGWVERLDDLGIKNRGVQRAAATGSALVAFADPDGIQLEVYVQTGLPEVT